MRRRPHAPHRDARHGSRRGQLYRGDPRRRQRAGTRNDLCRAQGAAQDADGTEGGRLPHGSPFGRHDARRGLGTPRLRCDERLYDHQGTDDLARRGGLHPAEHQGLGGIFARAGRHACRHQQGHRIAGRYQPGFLQNRDPGGLFQTAGPGKHPELRIRRHLRRHRCPR